MSETVFVVELQATCESEVPETAVEVMRAELAGLSPQVTAAEGGFRVSLALADAPNGFFTGVEAAATSAVARATVAATVAELDGVDYTQLHVTTQPAATSRPPQG